MHTIVYLAKMKSPLNRIKIIHLYNLCYILADTKIHQVSYLRDKYLENNLWFDEALSFLEDLKITTVVSDELLLSRSSFSSVTTLPIFKEQLLHILSSSKGSISQHIRYFLVNFRKEKDEIFFIPNQTEKLKFSDIRNLLQELEFLSLDHSSNRYFINSKYHNYFFDFVCHKGMTSEKLKNKLEENDELGLKAEERVIDYEIKRLTNVELNFDEIEHTSLINCLAGYDIKSYENYLDSHSNKIARYIEVKAVSSLDYKFYWSRNEKEAAYILGESYYLYLLPVATYNTFDFDRIKIIKDPYKNIYLKQNEWIQTEECISFSISTHN